MIKFKKLEYEDSAIIYQTTLEQIKKIYEKNPEQAGELAIAAIEVALTGGEHSSDDYFIDVILEQNKFLSTKNIASKHKKVDSRKEKRIEELQLREIIELIQQGLNQTQIGNKLGVSKQAISKRMGVLRTEFPELLSTSQPILVDDNLTSTTCQPLEESQVVVNLTEVDSVDTVDNLSTEVDSQPENSGQFVNQVNQVHPNVNVNVNDNVNVNVNDSAVSSNEETLPLISLSELNQMGARYMWLDGETIEIQGTGKQFKIK